MSNTSPPFLIVRYTATLLYRLPAIYPETGLPSPPLTMPPGTPTLHEQCRRGTAHQTCSQWLVPTCSSAPSLSDEGLLLVIRERAVFGIASSRIPGMGGSSGISSGGQTSTRELGQRSAWITIGRYVGHALCPRHLPTHLQVFS